MKKAILILGCTLLVGLLSSCKKKEYDIYATLYGTVSDHETGEPIANASVMLNPGGRTQTTGANGRYEFNDLDPQQYTLSVQKAGYSTNRKTITAVVGEETEANIPLTKNN